MFKILLLFLEVEMPKIPLWYQKHFQLKIIKAIEKVFNHRFFMQ